MARKARSEGTSVPSKAPAPRPSADNADVLENTVAVLMAGGIGTRFWPLSTPRRPKQFLTEWAEHSLFMMSGQRARWVVPADRILVMTNAAFSEKARAQAPDVSPDNIILEPLRRDTAPAIILAALAVQRRWPGAVMLVFPSDHHIEDERGFRETMAAAVRRAREGGLGTIGIRPTWPATGYGYLRVTRTPQVLEPTPVEEFIEKPDQQTAEKYVRGGRYVWNAGIFAWQAEALLAAARRHLPETHDALADLVDADGRMADPDRAREAFERVEPVSVDFGIMEKADDVWCVPATFHWDDVGGWLAVERLMEADADGNRLRGWVYLDGTTGCTVIGKSDRPLAVTGLKDCVIVQSEDGTLVCHKSATEDVKRLIQRVLEDEQAADERAANAQA